MQANLSPGLAVTVIYDELCTFEFGIAVEVFGLPRPELDFPWYQHRVISAEGSRVRATGGVVIESDGTLQSLAHAKTIIIPGWRNSSERPPDRLLKAIQAASIRGARCVSICSGVFVLAAAGLLDGKRATTHWQHIPELKRAYPGIDIAEDVLYVDEGNVITSAGSAAGIDACVHLVRRDFGAKVANGVARRLVMQPHREGGQAQYVPKPVQQGSGHAMSEIMHWARGHLADPIGLSTMARQAATSERTFYRKFNASVGMTPMAWLQRERISLAQELLESGDRPLEKTASECGYQSLETFRVAFKRLVGTSPAAYRSRFRERC